MRLSRIPPYVIDGALALLLAVPTVAGLLADESQVARPWWVLGPLAALTALPLVVRRSRALAVFAITTAAWLGLAVVGIDTFAPGVAVAVYTLAAHCERRVAIRAAIVGLAAVLPIYLATNGSRPGSAIPTLVVLVASWILGDNLRTRRAYLRELEEKAKRLERERAESDRRAAAEEQARIARELHDVIAHNVSVMVLQAAGGREVFDAEPARARDALASIEATGREALTELRRLLGLAHAGEDGASVGPQPGLVSLGALVDQVRGAGLEVELVFEGDEGDVPPAVELSAYRIVQEALTNTLRHAFAKHAWVFVRRTDGEFEVEVLDDGAGPSPTGSPDGRGLVGMRERVALFEGELEAGPRKDGGFRIRARLPLREESS
jgi:signal transduction histidine kinase